MKKTSNPWFLEQKLQNDEMSEHFVKKNLAHSRDDAAGFRT